MNRWLNAVMKTVAALALIGLIYWVGLRPALQFAESYNKDAALKRLEAVQHSNFISLLKVLSSQATIYNYEKKPDDAIDTLIGAIKENNKSNPVRDHEFYRMEAEFYDTLAFSLDMKGDKARAGQAMERSREAQKTAISMEQQNREKGLNEVLSR